MTTVKPIEINLVERVYSGSPRWFEERESYWNIKGFESKPFLGTSYTGDDPLRSVFTYAWGRDSFRLTNTGRGPDFRKFFEGLTQVQTCVFQQCLKRTQIINQKPDLVDLSSSFTDQIRCKSCRNILVKLLYRPIRNKWLYVFAGYPGLARQQLEIYIQDEGQWYVYGPPGKIIARRKRHIDRKGTQQNKGVLEVIRGEDYQFFLSPIQLTENALAYLVSLANQKPKPPIDPPNKRDGTNEQLDGSMVERVFYNSPDIKYIYDKGNTKVEIVPIADPFVWSEEVNEWDYRPILEAQYEFLSNESLNAKKNIASILKAFIGKSAEDELDLIDELNEESAEPLKAHSKAHAWLYQYEEYITLLSKEVRNACLRLIEWLNSDAHRVVEMSCQEELDEPGLHFPLKSPLEFGMLHYASALWGILGCPHGQAFVTRLSSMPMRVSADPKREKERIPYKNVLYPTGDDLKALRKIDNSFAALSVFLTFAPAVVRRAPRFSEADRFVEHLKRLGVETEVTGQVNQKKPMGYQEFRALKKVVSLSMLEHRVKKIGQALFPVRMQDNLILKLKLLDDLESSLASFFSLLTGVKIYSEDPSLYEGHIEKLKRSKEKLEYPFKVIGFFVEQGKFQLALSARKNYGIDIGQNSPISKYIVLSEGMGGYIEPEALSRFERNMKLYQFLSKIDRILTGPVALVFGGMDLVIQVDSTFKNWGNGLYGEAIASAMKTTAHFISVSIGLIKTAALFSRTAVSISASLVPARLLGIIGALIFLAEIILWVFSKNELEKFAAHCFLGDEYGRGEGKGPAWAEGEGYQTWNSGHDNYFRQNRYLMNLICGFKVLVHPVNKFSGAGDATSRIFEGLLWGGTIQPGYLPPGCIAEVIVIGHFLDDTGHKDLQSTALINIDTGDYIVFGDQLENHKVVSNGAWGTEEFRYFQVQLIHKLKKGMTVLPMKDIPYPKANWTLKVRIDIGGTGHFLPLGKNKYVEISNKEIWINDKIKSSLNP